MRGGFVPKFWRNAIANMKRVFLIGYPIAHSLSPALHNAAFRACALDWQYELLETPRDKLAEAVTRLRAADCAGANVTIPHKEAILELLDAVGEDVRKISAVNTIVKRADKLIGKNTDAYGFLQALRDAHVELHGRRVVVFGAGGAARAAAFALAGAGVASLSIFNRTALRAATLADFLQTYFPNLALNVNYAEALRSANLIVNATAVGMSPRENESPMPLGCTLPRDAIAFDLVYRPAQTKFLRDAEQAGAQVLGGLGMLVHQGASAFKLWTEHDAPVDVMFNAAREALRS